MHDVVCDGMDWIACNAALFGELERFLFHYFVADDDGKRGVFFFFAQVSVGDMHARAMAGFKYPSINNFWGYLCV